MVMPHNRHLAGSRSDNVNLSVFRIYSKNNYNSNPAVRKRTDCQIVRDMKVTRMYLCIFVKM